MEGGRGSGTRTHTLLLATDFESVKSTSYIIPPFGRVTKLVYGLQEPHPQGFLGLYVIQSGLTPN